MSKNPLANAAPVQYNDSINSEKYFDKQKPTLGYEQRVKLAEAERNKGNEAMKSKDFDEAIGFYNKSMDWDNKQASTYCNRALAYLKKNCSLNLI